jgi:hypothetical protein
MDDSVESAPSTRGAKARSRRGAAATLAVVFAVVLWGGYSHRWSWTGINGATATLWDWLHLLLLPLLLPTVVVPLMMPVAMSRVQFPQSAPAAAAGDDDPQATPPPRAPGEGARPEPESRRSASG